MSLKKNIELFVDGYSIHPSSPLKLYRGDSVALIFKLNQFKYEEFTNSATGMVYRTKKAFPLEPYAGELLIEGPNGDDSAGSTQVIEDSIVFELGSEYTEVPGMSRAQLVLMCDEGHRLALPEFEFEVRNLITDKEILPMDDIISTHDGVLITTSNGDTISITK